MQRSLVGREDQRMIQQGLTLGPQRAIPPPGARSHNSSDPP
jgi:hypothetical protein